MTPSDFTFSMLAAAVKAAGGTVHVSATDLLMLNAASQIQMQDDGRGGQILTLIPRTDTNPQRLKDALSNVAELPDQN